MRIGSLARDRTLPLRVLFARIDGGLRDWADRLGSLTDDARGRTGLHPTLGEMPATEILERFVLGHAEGHVAQLESILGGRGRREHRRPGLTAPTGGWAGRRGWCVQAHPTTVWLRTGTDGLWLRGTLGPTLRSPGACTRTTGAERDAMNAFKSQTFRIVMFLSVLASSSLVLTAGRRWF